MRTSPTSAAAAVKLIDFGNCIAVHKVSLYYKRQQQDSERDRDNGFDVQTLAYRAPEVAAGLALSPAIDLWSLGCVLLECATGEPLFTTSSAVYGAANVTGQETENEVILRQIELLVNDGRSLAAVRAAYRTASCYRGQNALTASSTSGSPSGAFASLSERLEAAAPVAVSPAHAHFHSFITRLLDVDPATRVGAKEALLHPFLQSFFPFQLVFGAAEPTRASPPRPELATPHPVRANKRRRTRAEREVDARPATRTGASDKHKTPSTHASSLRAALRLIPPLKKKAT